MAIKKIKVNDEIYAIADSRMVDVSTEDVGKFVSVSEDGYSLVAPDSVLNVESDNVVKNSVLATELNSKITQQDMEDYTDKYLDKTEPDTSYLAGKIQIGDINTNVFNALLHIRKVVASITGKAVNGACFTVNADGTASFMHKTYNDDGTGAKNAAVLRFSNKGIQFAVNTGSGNVPTEAMYHEVLTEGYYIAGTGISIDGRTIATNLDDLEDFTKIEKSTFALQDSIKYENTFIQLSGALKTKADYNFIVTKLLRVSAGQLVDYKIYHTQALPIIALYTAKTPSAATFVDSVIGIKGWSEGTYTVPSDGYIAFSMSSAHLDESYIKFTNHIPDNIEAYVKSAISASSFLPQKILCFGDSILGNDGQTVEHLAEYTGSQVLNAAVGGTSVSPRTSTGSIYFPLDGENIITAFTTGDWSTQNAVKSQHTQQVRDRIDMLQSLDASTIDLIILAWGTNDYTQGKTIEQITASLGHCIDMLQETYPLCRILVLCNTWRFFSLTSDSDNMVYNVSTGKEIANAIEDFCTNRRISVMNGYKLMETSLKNATTYFDNVTTGGDTDQQSGIEVPSGSGQYYSGVHYNDNGNKMYAHLINGKIRSIY